MELGLVNMDPVPKCVASSETHAHASMLLILFAIEHFLKTGIYTGKSVMHIKGERMEQASISLQWPIFGPKGF